MNITDPLLYDTIAITCVIVSIFLSLTKGLVRELISLTEWVLSFWLTYLFHDIAADMLTAYIPINSVAQLAGVASTFIVFWLLLYFVGKKIVSALRTKIPAKADMLGGILFGALRGIALPIIIFNLILLFSISRDMQHAILKSHSYQFTQRISEHLFGITPQTIIERTNKDIEQQI
ncbi:MAG: CvpA family protein [Alphaproteobacteria bacterium]|nr:CvpA family protein [Alphaproteobacteria bacterium]